jgi:dipeptidyl-peptidase II
MLKRTIIILILIISILYCMVTNGASTTIPRGAKGTIKEFPPTTKYFNQTIDHFSYYSGNTNNDKSLTFQQKYLYYDKWWKKNTGPILFYFGNEGGIEDFYNNSGAMFDMAPKFDALLVFLEHRYYGVSLPKSSLSAEDLRYLTIEQALADTTIFLSNKESIFGCEKSKDACKVVLFGGSYGGMLAAWHRLKYPHISVGALAASAPVDIYPTENKEKEFYDSFISVFTEYGDATCGKVLDDAFQIVSKTTDFQSLSNYFNVCKPITTANQVSKLLFYLKGAAATLAMLDYPYAATFVTNMPANPVQVACKRLLKADEILSGMNDAINVFVNYTGQLECHNISMEMVGGSSGVNFYNQFPSSLSKPSLGSIYRTWNYQACTQLILEPLTSDGNGFYVEDKDQIKEVEAVCRERYPNTLTRELWMLRAYGNGEDIVKHTTNMIFSDGDKDPWSVGGVPMNATSPDGSVFHIMIRNSAHHQDLRFRDDLYDSKELLNAREQEIENIGLWLS